MNQPNMIIGAGLSGLITACAFPGVPVYEAGERKAMHQALLRFRSDAVSTLTGIPFKRVTVRKSIYLDGHQKPRIDLANMYSQKCLGALRGDRSIWNTDTVERFIAPPDFYERLIDRVGEARIHFHEPVEFDRVPDHTINTAPLNIVIRHLALGQSPGLSPAAFKRAPIAVRRYGIHNCKDVYQTIYFPDPSHSLYRASITDNILICEFIGAPVNAQAWLNEVAKAFALDASALESLGAVEQRYGKIDPIDSGIRKSLLFALTTEHKLYSIGRFATWRNILLDDVVHDIKVVKQLMDADRYSASLKRTTT